MTNKTISIILGPNCDLEAIALRSFLEYLGFVVILRPIGRPNHLIHILKEDMQTKVSEFLIFCFHGQNGKFVMPKLSIEIYETNEPKHNFDFVNISEFAKLNGQNVIVTGCTIGNKKNGW